MTTAVELVRRGYFPRELPPVFESRRLGALLRANPGAFPTPPQRHESLSVNHNLARTGGLRRALRVPNPREYLVLATALEKHWPALWAHLKTQNLSRSRPTRRVDSGRALVPRLKYGEIPKLRAQSWRGRRFIVRADISEFYGSIYTHSVPWALHTKAVAKTRRGSAMGDEIDRALRKLNSGQTVGIPIGPDASFVVAELLLTAVDSALQAELGSLHGYRYFDDFEFACTSMGEAENLLFVLEGVLADYELVLNPTKTEILEIPQPIQELWVGELRRFPIRRGRTRDTINDLVSLFSRALDEAGRHPHQGVLKYALHRCRGLPVRKIGWRTFQGLILTAVSADPATMPLALDLLRHHASRLGTAIDRNGLSDVIEGQITRNATLRNGSEVAWAIWAALLFNIDLSKQAGAAISELEDDFVALLALDAEASGRFPNGGIDRTKWNGLASEANALYREHWLLAYESVVQGWLTASAAAVGADPFFSVLQGRDVRFYNKRRFVPPFTGPAAPLPGGFLPAASV